MKTFNWNDKKVERAASMPKPIRVERKMVHGQEIEVKIYAAGQEGIAMPKIITDEDMAAFEMYDKSRYEPLHEEYKVGLPAEPQTKSGAKKK